MTPDFNIPCPVWDAFLKKITAKHPELIEYFQRLLGYALSRTAEEETFEFFFGPGGNGKGTLLTTMLGIMGDYAMTLGMEALLSSYGERHSTEVADLAGKLVVVAQETDEGRSWNEGRIKNLTGRDRIRARFVKKNSFEFQTTWVLIAASNAKPRFRTVDEAVRRRLRLSPFDVVIPDEEKDPTLKDKLKAEPDYA